VAQPQGPCCHSPVMVERACNMQRARATCKVQLEHATCRMPRAQIAGCAYNMQHAACCMLHAACCMQQHASRVGGSSRRPAAPAICNMQRTTCNMQHATCNMQHATCNMQRGNMQRQQPTAPADCALERRMWHVACRIRDVRTASVTAGFQMGQSGSWALLCTCRPGFKTGATVCVLVR